ncbi:MAG: hypothetical protein A3E88_06155 [Legionellales bacterium RIFCSPHIGHO2_12_FULL_35_11]|nr:MAG: hypothetical protein A3E88_06155 [Legionellales bacterium RIFCSPHIGHO2_12_FULL_35_11]
MLNKKSNLLKLSVNCLFSQGDTRARLYQTAKQPNSQTAKQPNSQTAKQPNSLLTHLIFVQSI